MGTQWVGLPSLEPAPRNQPTWPSRSQIPPPQEPWMDVRTSDREPHTEPDALLCAGLEWIRGVQGPLEGTLSAQADEFQGPCFCESTAPADGGAMELLGVMDGR